MTSLLRLKALLFTAEAIGHKTVAVPVADLRAVLLGDREPGESPYGMSRKEIAAVLTPAVRSEHR